MQYFSGKYFLENKATTFLSFIKHAKIETWYSIYDPNHCALVSNDCARLKQHRKTGHTLFFISFYFFITIGLIKSIPNNWILE